MSHHIIYVPGIKDDVFHAQSIIIKFWRLWGVRGHCHPLPWSGQGDYAAKADALLAVIDGFAKVGDRVSLVGASAGASAVLNAYAARRATVARVVYICAKINHPETVSPATLNQNPAFESALEALQANLKSFDDTDKSRFHSFYSTKDRLIPYGDTQIAGVADSKLAPLGHGMAIIYGLTVGFPKLLRVLNQAA